MNIITTRTRGIPIIIGNRWEKVAAGTIIRERNGIAGFEFKIYPGNPGYGQMREFATLVDVVDDRTGLTVFEGRVYQWFPTMDEGGSLYETVLCEGVEGYLCDSEHDDVAERQWSGAREYVTDLLDNHNSRVEEYKRVYVGSIGDSDAFTLAIEGGDGVNTWTLLHAMLEHVGGEFRVRRAADGLLYLDWGKKLGTSRATTIALAKNMRSATRSPDPSAVITRLRPYGAKIVETQVDENGEEVEVETDRRLTIESVNDGLPYIEDAVAIEEYGIIEGRVTWDDVTSPSELLSRGKWWLGQNNKIPVTYEVSSYDLSLLGIDYDAFDLLDWYPCINPYIGLEESLEIVRMEVDVNDPTSKTFDLGESAETLSRKTASIGSLGKVVESVKSQQQTAITNLQNSVKATKASINVMEDSIVSRVKESTSTTIREELSGIEVGARNLILASVEFTDEKGTDSFLSIRPTVSDYGRAVMQTAEKLTFSFDYEVPEGSTGDLQLALQSSSSDYDSAYMTPTPDWPDLSENPTGHLAFTIDVADQHREFGTNLLVSVPGVAEGGAVFIRHLKMEIGSMAADWTPAPEDMDQSVADAKSDLQTALEGTQADLAATSQSVSDIQSSNAEVYEIVYQNQSKISELVQVSSGFEMNFQTITDSITQINDQYVTDRDEQYKYIRFIDGEIWIGKLPEEGEDDLQLVMRNDRISFLMNNVEIAYFSDDALYVTNVTVTGKLTVGRWEWGERANGNLGLRWIGGDS